MDITRTESSTDQEVNKKRKLSLENKISTEEIEDEVRDQKEFSRIILECKDLVVSIKQKLERGEDISSELLSLSRKRRELITANRMILIKRTT